MMSRTVYAAVPAALMSPGPAVGEGEVVLPAGAAQALLPGTGARNLRPPHGSVDDASDLAEAKVQRRRILGGLISEYQQAAQRSPVSARKPQVSHMTVF
jgi:hypothetical protein